MRKDISYFNSVIIYEKGTKVRSDGKIFISKKENNIYHIPIGSKDDLWWEIDNSDYIEFHCPHCGKEIFLNIELEEHEEVYREDYNCSCGKNFKVEYDIILGKLNINTGIYLKDK